ncbi:hypothetical protein HOLleu_03906 [Holothuria leucospilota]|uniref:Uncharacterized protein n=1 Tax=Holothuria leucospilota TaxID=206669 RepID=A0A9Q1BPW8_HOLLE|nr:hypothetical protein HOLleu_33644 [Holothuria leucospilota]KAJ8030610.1 hypothetical protein HOLleu_27072 [Holothuria leucospilota]KAJ8050627.1 hypothetical protein HOLleu_03906 [Holothuria leucospilota]
MTLLTVYLGNLQTWDNRSTSRGYCMARSSPVDISAMVFCRPQVLAGSPNVALPVCCRSGRQAKSEDDEKRYF